MGIRDRLREKNAGPAPAGASSRPATAVAAGRGPATAPGQLFAFREKMMDADEKIGKLETQVKQLEAGKPVVRLDARHVRPSALANRHPLSFETPEFAAFREEIRSAGGNVEPVQVRRSARNREEYEIVYGHRRHRACLELGLPLLAMVVEASDQELFATMDRENRLRKDLTPYEAGLHYQRALEQGLWPSQGKMAEALGVPESIISRTRALVNLPKDVLEAFRSPLELQYRWGDAIAEALKADRAGVLQRARAIAKSKDRPSGPEVVRQLVGQDDGGAPVQRAVTVGGRKIGTISSQGGRVTVSLGKGAVTGRRLSELQALLERFLAKK